MKEFILMAALSSGVAFSGFAQQPAPKKSDVWGHSPTAQDDRFSNPKSKLYAGPDGYYNTGIVRATVANAAKTAYGYNASFQANTGEYDAVKGLQTLHFEFGTATRPKPGVYKVGAKGSAAQKVVHLSFADVGNSQIKEWSAADGAGTLTISLVNGFTYFTCRNVLLLPTGLSNKGEMSKPMTLGFEGALAPE